jgi:hypothetical protein
LVTFRASKISVFVQHPKNLSGDGLCFVKLYHSDEPFICPIERSPLHPVSQNKN